MVETIINSFEIWISAKEFKKNGRGRGANNNGSYGIKKLRELIYELAIKGKLISQNINDEPVNELVNRILKKRIQLLNEGILKNRKFRTKIHENEIPFSLPNGWKWVRLGEIGNIFNGNSINAKVKEEKYTNIGDGLPFIATKDVGYGWEKLDYDNGISIPENESGFNMAHSNSVLICSEGGSAGKKCGITDRDIFLGNKLFANELFGDINPKYILTIYQAPTFYTQFSQSMTGIIGGISLIKFLELLVPIPPLAEQRRIVNKVDELISVCNQLEQQQTENYETHQILVTNLLNTFTNAADNNEFIELWKRIKDNFDVLFTTEESVEQLKQTILQLAVMGKLVPQDPNDKPASILLEKIAEEKVKLIEEGKIKEQRALPQIGKNEKPFDIPKVWEWARMQTLVFLLGDGLHGTPNYTNGTKYYFINGNNLNNGKIEIKPDTKTVSFDEMQKYKKDLSSNSVLISINGTLGNVAFYNGEEIMLGKSACYFNLSNAISKHYIKILIQSPYFNNYAIRNATGTTIKNLGLKAMNEFPVPLPNITEQKFIVAKVDELFSICDALKEQISNSQITKIQLADAVVERAVA